MLGNSVFFFPLLFLFLFELVCRYAFIYVIRGWDKIVIVDTGAGVHDLYSFIESHKMKLNPQSLPYLILLTHWLFLLPLASSHSLSHFDHIGGVKFFKNANVIDVCLSSRNKVYRLFPFFFFFFLTVSKTFSNNLDINSLALAHPGAKVEGCHVTRWLDDGELVYLDDSEKIPQKAISVLHSPGHTPDSASFCFTGDKRIFIGDILYPYTVTHLDCIGSNLDDFVSSINRILLAVKEMENQGNTIPLPQVEEHTEEEAKPPTMVPPKIEEGDQVPPGAAQFLSILGLSKENITFSLTKLFSICDK